jgi:cation diffusion facilitator family transporter
MTEADASYRIRRVTILGAVFNVVLSIIKVATGLLFGSVSVVVDGVHSLGDLVTDAAVMIGTHLSEKDPDAEHPYGHKWYETFATVAISLILVFTGLIAIYKSASVGIKIEGSKGYAALIFASLISILVKEMLYRKTRDVAMVTNCSAVYANAWHHRSDALSSMAVLAGLLTQMVGFQYGDQTAAVIVGALIVAAGGKMFLNAIKDFTDAAIDKQLIEKIENIINADPAIKQMHKLRSRSVGREIFLDFHILVNPNLNVEQAHEISMDIQRQIQKAINLPLNIIVHIEPDKPCHRK